MSIQIDEVLITSLVNKFLVQEHKSVKESEIEIKKFIQLILDRIKEIRYVFNFALKRINDTEIYLMKSELTEKELKHDIFNIFSEILHIDINELYIIDESSKLQLSYITSPEIIRTYFYQTLFAPILEIKGYKINDITDSENRNLLMELLHTNPGAKEIFELLMKAGIDLNHTDNYGCTPLMYTTNSRLISAYQYIDPLLTNGANPNVKDNNQISVAKFFNIYDVKSWLWKLDENSFEKVYEDLSTHKYGFFKKGTNGDEMNDRYGLICTDKDLLSWDEFKFFSSIFNKNYKPLPIPLFIRNYPSWFVEEKDYLHMKEQQPDLYNKIINWD